LGHARPKPVRGAEWPLMVRQRPWNVTRFWPGGVAMPPTRTARPSCHEQLRATQKKRSRCALSGLLLTRHSPTNPRRAPSTQPRGPPRHGPSPGRGGYPPLPCSAEFVIQVRPRHRPRRGASSALSSAWCVPRRGTGGPSTPRDPQSNRVACSRASQRMSKAAAANRK